jgi:HTH-type transcriptional regulator/antitoxin HigA
MGAKTRAAGADNIQTEPVMASPARTRPKVGKHYRKLVAPFPIRPIRNEQEYDAAIKVVDELAVRDEQTLSSDERDYLGALVMLVEAYDAEHYRIDTSKLRPAELLNFLMDQRGMSFNDLVDVLGSKAAASYLLKGAGALSRAQCFTLGEHFGVEPGMFLSPKSEPKHKSRSMSFVKQ